METITLPKELAIAIAQVLAQLPAGQVAKMLISLDDCIRAEPSSIDVAAARAAQSGDLNTVDFPPVSDVA